MAIEGGGRFTCNYKLGHFVGYRSCITIVEHVLLRCALGEEATMSARDRLKEIDIETLLYTEEGIIETIKISGEFERESKEFRERNGEQAKKDRELGWGRGGLEE